MRATLRVVLGLVSLVAGIIFIMFVPKASTGTITLSNEVLFGVILMVAWLFFSAASKICMIAGSKATWPNWTAIAAWSVFGIVLIAIAYGTTINPVPLTRIDTMLTALFFFGWMLIDLFDLMLLRPIPIPD